jgi:uncharacterized protein YijF (DUF1287 family)
MVTKRKNNFRVYETGDLVALRIDNSDAGYGIVLDRVFGADGMEEYYMIEMCNNSSQIYCFYYELEYIS